MLGHASLVPGEETIRNKADGDLEKPVSAFLRSRRGLRSKLGQLVEVAVEVTDESLDILPVPEPALLVEAILSHHLHHNGKDHAESAR